MGSIVTRLILMVVGYAYPAYECFKGVEKSRPDIDALRFWCQYWMIIAVLTIFERIGDTFISWFPMYNEAKVAFIIYLWYPKTKGATYIYMTFLKPYVSFHEPTIDRHLNELKTRAGDLAYNYWQRAAMYVQARFLELLHYVASQTPNPPVVTQNVTTRDQPPAGGQIVEEEDYHLVNEAEALEEVPEGYREPLVNRRRAANVW
ncbi:putative HVA22-like protein g [Selaginella moellendorffii]|uniref:putative HVA22-like protein g n=1 Tax=Selaginella moellendorffii TaxID=88036 RepID=UPI000D1C9919|nr:putative HVA22-like protein g [Selaginella moellendorffii]|eukprot:XP_024544532.1 putative HVA22-like protein g [Selaginella moellendorffii]